MTENEPCLVSCKTLKPEYNKLNKINITFENFTIGRSLGNSVVIPYLSISRTHCTFKKSEEDEWFIEDHSSFGIKVNGVRLGKGVMKKLAHDDVVTLDPQQEFVYKFVDPTSDVFVIPRKRVKLENTAEDTEFKMKLKCESATEEDDLINDMKLKFEESQTYEMKHIAVKLENAKQMQTNSKILKEHLEIDMNRKIQQLESNYASQIENLKGEKDEVERQKALLIEERDAQLAALKDEMQGKISELMEQIQKHNETESELLKENNQLKENLLKEREEFLSELNKESCSKQEMLEKLNAKIKEQEEIRIKERQELEEALKRETELLRLAKEEEIKILEEQKKQREQELMQELNEIKKNLEAQEKEAAEQRLLAAQQLNAQIEQIKKLSDEEKVKIEQMMQERQEIEKKLSETETTAKKKIEEAEAQVKEREIELAALAAERIQQQADQSSEVISSLQQQLETMRSQLQSMETEKNTLLESLCLPDSAGEGTSKQSVLSEVGEIMESELQCSICAELFVKATTLNCSHSFCKYCITMWKKKKKDCPICRAPITSECKSLVLDSLIEKLVEKDADMKQKREEILKSREEMESELAQRLSREDSCGSDNYDSGSDDVEELEEEEYDEDFYDDHYYWRRPWRRRYYDASDTDSGSDVDSDTSAPASPAAPGESAAADQNAGAAADSGQRTAGVSDNTTGRANSTGSNRPRGIVPGVPGSFYGGYGRCFSCGARGHWAPGCPFRERR